MKDIKSLLLLLMSAGMLGTWIYHIYDKTIYTNRIAEVALEDSVKVTNALKDSLHKFYAGAISDLDSQLDSSRNSAEFIRNNLDKKLTEINVLKTEISDILKNKNSSKADLSTARTKIDELQQKVNELKDQNTSMEEEKSKLSTTLNALSEELKVHEQNIRKLNQENKDLAEKINIASSFMVSDIKFSAMNQKSNKEMETREAAKTDKFVFSFNLLNNIADYENTEIIIIVTTPTGQTIQNPVWDSGKFSSKNDGVKNFTRKLKFDYKKGEQKNLLFSIETDKYEKGIYKLQVYHNGILVAKASQTLK